MHWQKKKLFFICIETIICMHLNLKIKKIIIINNLTKLVNKASKFKITKLLLLSFLFNYFKHLRKQSS